MKPIQFLKDTRTELRNVVWPTRTRAITYGLIIIGFSLGLGYLLGAFDMLFKEVLKVLFIK
jgi:preprotein translocase subunit SecE